MNLRRVAVAVAALSAAALTVPTVADATWGRGGPDAVGLLKGGTKIIEFDTDHTDRTRRSTDVRGLQGDTRLVGIDRRVQDGKLYGVGDQGGLYTVSGWGKAELVGRLSVALSGTAFGVDFNPAANALRIVSNTGQNLRHPFGADGRPAASTAVDGTLNYLGTTAVGVAGAAYTNNDLAASTATSLFDIDTALDQVALQSPANSGGLAATGKLGVDAVDAGFDIRSDLTKGVTVANTGYAVLSVDGHTLLYGVDLLTGAASYQGWFHVAVVDLAVDLD